MTKITEYIPVYKPNLTGNEKKYVNQCLDTSWISSKGDFVTKFEDSFSEFTGIPYAASVTNGTVALHVALLALGIGSNDEVIVPTLTYIASVNSITYTGAKPVFVDSLKDTWQLDPADIEKKITHKTKAIMVVHLYGQACNMDAIMDIAKRHNLKVVEDCAEAIGTKFRGKFVGTFGDVACFSFFGNKTITTGEGGMVLSGNKEIINYVKRLKGQGLAEGREYWHDIIGYNYRMTNICAAIGSAQLEKVNELITKKRIVADTYMELLKGAHVAWQHEQSDTYHSYWMFSILTNNTSERDGLREYLRARNIETRPVFYPVHTMPMYKIRDDFPVADTLASRGINLPSWPDLKHKDIVYITSHIEKYINEHRA